MTLLAEPEAVSVPVTANMLVLVPWDKLTVPRFVKVKFPTVRVPEPERPASMVAPEAAVSNPPMLPEPLRRPLAESCAAPATEPETLRVPAAPMETPLAREPVKLSVPFETVKSPVVVLAPESVNVAAPVLVNVRLLEAFVPRTPANIPLVVWLTVNDDDAPAPWIMPAVALSEPILEAALPTVTVPPVIVSVAAELDQAWVRSNVPAEIVMLLAEFRPPATLFWSVQ